MGQINHQLNLSYIHHQNQKVISVNFDSLIHIAGHRVKVTTTRLLRVLRQL